MNLLQDSFEEKPYNRCLNCAHIGKQCDGPNFLSMDIPRLSEWCNLRKKYLRNQDPKWTNTYIAEATLLSKVTVDRFLAGNVDDIKMSTVSRILRVLVNGSWGQYPCASDSITEPETVYVDNPELVKIIEETTAENKRLQEALDNMAHEHRDEITATHAEDQQTIAFLKERIRFKEEQMTKKDRMLDERRDFMLKKDKVIVILSIFFDRCNARYHWGIDRGRAQQ